MIGDYISPFRKHLGHMAIERIFASHEGNFDQAQNRAADESQTAILTVPDKFNLFRSIL